MKDSLSAPGYMNSTDTNSGSWNNTRRRAWCNSGFRQALSTDLRSAFKEFRVISGRYYGGSQAGGANVTSQDYFALAAEKEVFGTNDSSTTNESSVLTQFTWYETTSNRVKTAGTNGVTYDWWERSPRYDYTYYFCGVYKYGSASYGNASHTRGLSPFGCM